MLLAVAVRLKLHSGNLGRTERDLARTALDLEKKTPDRGPGVEVSLLIEPSIRPARQQREASPCRSKDRLRFPTLTSAPSSTPLRHWL
jgi:hypothetical protein